MSRCREVWRMLVAGGVLLSVLTVGCASGGVSSQSANHWREDMGRMSSATLNAGLDKIVRKYALQIARRTSSSHEIYYETTWTEREVLAQEQMRGVTHARNRIVLRGRRLMNVYRVTWDLENETVTAGVEGWHPDPVPDEVVEEFRPIYSDLLLEVRTGVIR